MIRVACSGFPVPVSRYFKELLAVEITETELGIPGAGTVRRWKREAPDGFVFAVSASKAIAQRGFGASKENAQAMSAIFEVAKSLDAVATLMAVPPEFGPTRPNRAALRAFAESLPKRGKRPPVVFDLPSWTPEQSASTFEGLGVEVACNPLVGVAQKPLDVAYIRLPGPAGFRSRYEDASLEKIAAFCKGTKAKQIFCVFCNVDMHGNARRVMEMLES